MRNNWAAVCLLLAGGLAQAAGVRVEFDPNRVDVGPFPTDFLTVPDPQQRTGLRVNLPLPDCQAQPAACPEFGLVNQIDGFSLRPRVRVKFSGPVNVDTLRSGVFFVWLDKLSSDEFGLAPEGAVTPVNQLSYDPATHTMYARPDDMFDQTRRYALLVTSAVRDSSGDPVEASDGFRACVEQQIGGDYCARVSEAVRRYGPRFAPANIAGGSVFTTLSATRFMEEMRRRLDDTPASYQRPASPNTFRLSGLSALVWRQEVRSRGDRFNELVLPAPLLSQAGLGRVGVIEIRSPRMMAGLLPIIPTLPTAAPAPPVTEFDDVSVLVLLPDRPAPAGGYPVVIAGHGIGDSPFGMPLALSLSLMQRGIAIVSLPAFGHAYGAASQLVFRESGGNANEVSFRGRGVDTDRNGSIEPFDGCVLLAPGIPIGLRDCLRQTALDLSQLTRVLQRGVDVDGDGAIDLSRTSLHYVGQSLGSFYGTIFNAIEPTALPAVLNVGGGSGAETALYSRSLQPLIGGYLASRNPSIQLTPAEQFSIFPTRFQPVQILTSQTILAAQSVFEVAEWVENPGQPAAFAPHLRASTLPGVEMKRVMFQYAVGDQTVPNPMNALLVRAANMREWTSVYRHDLARQAVPQLAANPHAYLADILDSPVRLAVALAAQTQAVEFLTRDTVTPPNVNPLVRPLFGRDLFETPEFLPEELNYQP